MAPNDCLSSRFEQFYASSSSSNAAAVRSADSDKLPASSQLQLWPLVPQGSDKPSILSSIPLPDGESSSEKPVQLLSQLLSELAGPWPTFDLIRCLSRLSKALPEEIKAGRTPFPPLDHVRRVIKTSYHSLSDFLTASDAMALRTTDSARIVTHSQLRDLVLQFRLPCGASTGRKPVVAVTMPNGPELAATIMAVATYFTAAPITQASGAEQFKADVLLAKANVILTTQADFEKLRLDSGWPAEHGIQVFTVSYDAIFQLNLDHKVSSEPPRDMFQPEPNRGDEFCIILFTSGTSGTKKVVPLSMHSLLCGAAFVIESWGVTAEDICLNMMPLYHVGGLVRNIFAPVLAGGSTICCNAFDPGVFWDVAKFVQPTWYYASPSMHALILSEARDRPDAVARSRIRLVCNAAGGLLPSLAYELRDTFNCIVLPSYGMTECMPISSPPLNYQLDRPGTSGTTNGPELAIFGGLGQKMPLGAVGNIHVRGEPVFAGYLLNDGTIDTSALQNGWFDTGDMGYMDQDGFLYITGRSKEVINRGGELISPFEVEEAIVSSAAKPESPIYGRVTQALAFSIGHAVLQEVVGIVLVTPPGVPRVDRRALYEALSDSLQKVKWPVLIVYMDDVPKQNNKVLRVKLGDRLGLPELNDDMPYADLHWEAECPPANTPLSGKIPSQMCAVETDELIRAVKPHLRRTDSAFTLRDAARGTHDLIIAPESTNASTETLTDLTFTLDDELKKTLHSYLLPERIHCLTQPLPLSATGDVDEVELQKILNAQLQTFLDGQGNPTEKAVTVAFADILSRSPVDIDPTLDFFQLGGDSLSAGKLLSALRGQFHMAIPLALVFNGGSVQTLSEYIDKNSSGASTTVNGSATDGDKPKVEAIQPQCDRTHSSTNLLLMFIQLLPMIAAYPIKRAFQWTIFVSALAYTQEWAMVATVPGRLLVLILSIGFARIVSRTVWPPIGILLKWILIGRHREGLYPMWGSYHTRWWLVQKLVGVCGMGHFGMTNTTKVWYYRLLGAHIGRNVTIDYAQLGEWDLLHIEDDAVLNNCTCRPFAAETNTTMYLGRIHIGKKATVGASSIVAPGATIPDGACIGPNSSSWELQDADESNRDLLSASRAKVHWALTLFLTIPLTAFSWAVSLVPWVGGLVGLVLVWPGVSKTPFIDMLRWFTGEARIVYHYLALVLWTFFGPIFVFVLVVGLRWLLTAIFGQLPTHTDSSRPPSQFQQWRANIIVTLFPTTSLRKVTELMGGHYEGTSMAVRALGGKVGKRVYWPGTGPTMTDYHLVEVGDDVVFGSRSRFITTDAQGSDKVVIGDGAMIADRVTLVPGARIGKGTLLGSGALTRRNKSYLDGAKYVGSQGGDCVCLDPGKISKRAEAKNEKGVLYEREDCICKCKCGARNTDMEKGTTSRASSEVSTADTMASSSEPESEAHITPFGRAFYQKKAPYHVLGMVTIFFYSSFCVVFSKVYWNVPSVSAIQLVNLLVEKNVVRLDHSFAVNAVLMWGLMSGFIAVLLTFESILAIAIVIAAKWALIGHRKPGNYSWDQSSYCQRWQVFLAIEKLRRQAYGGNGVLGMLTGTHWIVMYFRALGAEIGRDCSLFANGRPSLMFTEPDLLTLGNRVAVDDASLVGHINSGGKFDLNRLRVDDKCVLRSGSRLLSGAEMKSGSVLLEHTLIMGGDVVEQGAVMQGWPAEPFRAHRVTLLPRQCTCLPR